MSEAFQARKFNCSAILPAIAHTDSPQLETIKAESSALDSLEKRDFGGVGFIVTAVKMSRKDEDELVSIQGKYIGIKNVVKRFESLRVMVSYYLLAYLIRFWCLELMML